MVSEYNAPRASLASDDYSSDVLINTCIAMLVHEIVTQRKLMNYTQKDVAAKTGLTQSAISRVESLSVVPTLPVLIRIIDVLGLELKLA